jgi:peptidoglycan LD-endopeptidase CwlK
MPSFSQQSLQLLATVDRKLYDICSDAIKIIDFTVINGFRNQEQQTEDFTVGKSKLQWPNSKHNTSPSQAIDLAPYPIDWSDLSRFYVLAGIILACAASRNIKIRWGGDWEGKFDIKNNKFNDIGHFELI